MMVCYGKNLFWNVVFDSWHFQISITSVFKIHTVGEVEVTADTSGGLFDLLNAGL